MPKSRRKVVEVEMSDKKDESSSEDEPEIVPPVASLRIRIPPNVAVRNSQVVREEEESSEDTASPIEKHDVPPTLPSSCPKLASPHGEIFDFPSSPQYSPTDLLPGPEPDPVPLPAVSTKSTTKSSAKLKGKGTGNPRSKPDNGADAEISVYFQVNKPASARPLQKKGHKAEKQDYYSFGPLVMSGKWTWNMFLSGAAECVHSFSWRFLEPSTAPVLPLVSENGFDALITQALGRQPAKRFLTVRMDMPRKQIDSLPWNNSKSKHNKDNADNESSSGKEPEDTLLAQGKRDDIINEYEKQLAVKYAPGLCAEHPNISCYHYRPANLHFELNRISRLVWASQIKQNKATFDHPVVPSAHFCEEKALKTKTPVKIPIVTAPTMPQPLSAPEQMVPPYMPHMLPYFMPPYMLPLPIMNPVTPSPSPSRKRSHEVLLGSSPVKATISLKEFCDKYGLPESTKERLEEMEFMPGDSLSGVPESEWKAVGFKLFSWNRVVRANTEYKKTVKK
ncbi:hypothetical protein PUNSTDRAFT_137572 [Punctularia strigosozonata HHB-11173 SS5]|uniref:uncharacterized protein n=1 Tax=Punctularia strigosozonata (strain HHB-11173) TaxID=741275 RepID=UPI00044169FC|nr:uncharacterized protein PUNSTDRAFT_137572 [Punctularia strigosozonata HHB-11173 SS5]EIN05459.1 hypothetical protein PUNSTDRAFT_137572 [Punctularia strigosozonata HHB-11173 SS5]